MTNPMTTSAILRSLADSPLCPEDWRTVLIDCADDCEWTSRRLTELARDLAGSGPGVGHPDYPRIGPNVQGG